MKFVTEMKPLNTSADTEGTSKPKRPTTPTQAPRHLPHKPSVPSGRPEPSFETIVNTEPDVPPPREQAHRAARSNVFGQGVIIDKQPTFPNIASYGLTRNPTESSKSRRNGSYTRALRPTPQPHRSADKQIGIREQAFSNRVFQTPSLTSFPLI